MLVTNYPVGKLASVSSSDNIGLCHTQASSETGENINIETTVSETFIAHTDNTDYFSKHFEQDILQAEDSSDELSSGNITVNGNALIANPNLPHSFTNDKVNTE